MKLLKALLAVLTTLAVAMTAVLLFWQDKNAPRYIQIYENEQEVLRSLNQNTPAEREISARLGCFYTRFSMAGRPGSLRIGFRLHS